ncbi:MAG: enoyl-[acyl-carrier-protein] reductase FabK [Clostridiales bacterium]|nr:enoyl-[acyl-carrier-protein] reductase FabK [Clostridiales bacterium]
MNTRVSELFGIQYPILQGGMAYVSTAKLAAAVSQAGGLGVISAMELSAEELREEIRKARGLTSKPFGVNLFLRNAKVEQTAQVVAQEKVPVVTTSAGMPSRFMPLWLSAGVKVVPVVPNVAMARRVVKDGAAAVIAEGCEAGGHIGELTTFTLVPQIREAVGVPVIAAGGIANGRGMAAALLLGASGVQCGTRFLAANECEVPQCFVDEILRARDSDTMVVGRRLGQPVRALKNSYMMEFAQREMDPMITNAELENYGSGALWRAVRQGDMVSGCIMAGQAASMVKDTLPARDIILRMVTEARELLSAAPTTVF